MKKEQWLWLIKGAAMGAADAVPGVSGGTIALITGIYERFIGALASFRPGLWRFIRVGDFRGLWQAIDGQFLAFLGTGILVSLFSVLSLMDYLLSTAAPVVWSFFMGVILVSLWQLSRGRHWHWQDALLLTAGLAISLFFATAPDMTVTVTPLTLVLGGILAISAMLLPGISGSFMLVLLGLYPAVVAAVHDRNLMVVLWVGLGCAIGILSFSRFLQWLLHNWHERVISFMLGFVAGALVKVWPWQDSGRWFTPQQYFADTQLDSWLWLSLSAMISGAIIGHFMRNRS